MKAHIKIFVSRSIRNENYTERNESSSGILIFASSFVQLIFSCFGYERTAATLHWTVKNCFSLYSFR